MIDSSRHGIVDNSPHARANPRNRSVNHVSEHCQPCLRSVHNNGGEAG